MSAIDFPASPTVGQSFTAGNSVTYVWNGLLWLASGASAGGDFNAFTLGPLVLSATTASVPVPVANGNSGGWYNPATGRYTPPAGRFYLYAALSGINAAAVANVIVHIRKNGTIIGMGQASTANVNYWAEVSADATADANGTDYFDITASGAPVTTNAYYITFGAYPISGVKGPPGDLPNGLKLSAETVLASPAASIDVTFPANCRKVEVEFAAFITGAGNVAISAQLMQSGTPLATGYGVQQVYGAASTAGASTSGAATSMGLITGIGISGTLKLFNNIGNAHTMIESYGPTATGFLTQVMGANNAALHNTITGARLFIPSDTFRAGSWMRSYVVT